MREFSTPPHVKTSKSREMAAVRSKNTAPELLARGLLWQLGVRYRIHVPTLPGRPDIYIPRLRLALFINGCFWHGHHCVRGRLPVTRREFWQNKIASNQARDERVYASLASSGVDVAVWWTCESREFSARCEALNMAYASRK